MLIYLGMLFIAAGLVIIVLGRMGVPLGHLPGDITYRGKSVSRVCTDRELNSAQHSALASAVRDRAPAALRSRSERYFSRATTKSGIHSSARRSSLSGRSATRARAASAQRKAAAMA